MCVCVYIYTHTYSHTYTLEHTKTYICISDKIFSCNFYRKNIYRYFLGSKTKYEHKYFRIFHYMDFVNHHFFLNKRFRLALLVPKLKVSGAETLCSHTPP